MRYISTRRYRSLRIYTTYTLVSEVYMKPFLSLSLSLSAETQLLSDASFGDAFMDGRKTILPLNRPEKCLVIVLRVTVIFCYSGERESMRSCHVTACVQAFFLSKKGDWLLDMCRTHIGNVIIAGQLITDNKWYREYELSFIIFWKNAQQ